MKFGPSFIAELAAAGLTGLPFSFDPNTGVVDDARLGEADRARLAAVIAAHDPDRPAPPLVRIIDKLALYQRMTDAEYEAMAQALAGQSARVRDIFDRADTFRSDAALWPLLNAMAVQVYGAARAAELLGA